MKSVAKLVVIALVFCLAYSTSALAENRGGATTLTPMVGYQMFDSDLELDDAASYGFGIGYNITPEVGVEFDLHYTPTEPEDYSSVDVDVWTFGMSGLYYFQPSADLNPYLAAGIGGVVYQVDGSRSDDEDYMLYWGGGFKYAVSENSALRLDLRHVFDRRADNKFSGDSDGSDWANHVIASVGMTFQFGGYSSKSLAK